MAFSIPSLTELLLLLLLVAPLFSLLIIRRRGGTRRKYHAIAGTVIHQILNFHRFYHYLTEISHQAKSFRILTSPFHSEVYTNDPAVVEHILSSNFQNYGKGPFNNEILSDLIGDGIFAVDGEKWRHQRKLASYEFSTRSLRESSSAVFKKNCIRLSRAIAEAADSAKEIDLQLFFVKSMTDSIMEVTMGVELNSLQATDAETLEFVSALDEASEIINGRYISPLWKIMRFFNVGSEATLKKKLRILDDFVFPLIQSRIDQVPNKTLQKEDMLSRFLGERERDPDRLSDRFLRDIILSFVIAGKDTTASTLSWFLYLLSKNPKVEEKLLKEIREAVGLPSSASFEDFAAKMDEESIAKMKYLQATISETLRLYPVLPLNGKICFSDDILPDGFSVKAGEFIVYQPYCMGRMKYLWGEDAEIFRPERWLNSDGSFRPESPFKFPVFQAGPRICLGKDFAYRQMKIYAALLLHFFSFKPREEDRIHYKMTMTLFMDPGLNVRIFRR